MPTRIVTDTATFTYTNDDWSNRLTSMTIPAFDGSLGTLQAAKIQFDITITSSWTADGTVHINDPSTQVYVTPQFSNWIRFDPTFSGPQFQSVYMSASPSQGFNIPTNQTSVLTMVDADRSTVHSLTSVAGATSDWAIDVRTSLTDFFNLRAKMTSVTYELKATVAYDYRDVVAQFTGGADVVDGTVGADRFAALGGNDVVRGLGGNDVIAGGAGNDRLSGQAGKDVLKGGAGDDRLSGDADRDVLKGGGGDDLLNGGSGADNLVGGAGDDRLAGGGSSDRLAGGSGADVFVIVRGGTDRVMDFGRGDDEIDLSGFNVRFGDLSQVDRGGDLEIRISGQTVVELVGHNAGDLAASDFVF